VSCQYQCAPLLEGQCCYFMLDLNELAVNYIAVDRNGVRKEFRIFYYGSIFSIVGDFYESQHQDVTKFLKEIIDSTVGFANGICDITWYARSKHDSDIVEAIKLAVRDGNKTIVIEYTDLDLN